MFQNLGCCGITCIFGGVGQSISNQGQGKEKGNFDFIF